MNACKLDRARERKRKHQKDPPSIVHTIAKFSAIPQKILKPASSIVGSHCCKIHMIAEHTLLSEMGRAICIGYGVH